MKTKSITKVTLLSIVVMSAITAVTLNSCQKESIKPRAVNSSAKSEGTISMAAQSNVLLNDINNMMFGMRKSQKSLVPGGLDSNSCVVITTDTVDKPNSVTYNYGSGCIGSDGQVRSGIVIFNYGVQDIRVVNNVISATFQGYIINGNIYNGSISITNTGPNGNGNLVLVQSGYFSSQAQNQIAADTVNINYNYEWIAGENSSPAANWQFSITGGCTYAFSQTHADSVVITSPLIKNAKNPGCNFYIQGTEYMVHNTPLGAQYQYVDFSNPGSCSGQEALTQNGVMTIVSQ